MRISLGMITRNIDKTNPLFTFIDNAGKYGHNLSNIILAYSGSVDTSVVATISAHCPLHLTNIRDTQAMDTLLTRRGMSRRAVDTMLSHENSESLWPYSYCRNIVLMQAAMNRSDVMIFVDSDVLPAVLKKEDRKLHEIDFIGSHVELLKQGAQVTSSEYSGYNILPIAGFEGQDELLYGLQKDSMSEWWKKSIEHESLIYQPDAASIKTCPKVLGGNIAVKTEAFKYLSPFFSSCYSVGGETYLTRGEDTILSKSIEDNGIRCMDTNTYIYHDTYANNFQKPLLKSDAKIQERFFYACMGWIGRNPFYNWLFNVRIDEEERLNQLKKGSEALAVYTKNDRFRLLPEAFEAAKANLASMIEKYKNTLDAWQEFLKGCE